MTKSVCQCIYLVRIHYSTVQNKMIVLCAPILQMDSHALAEFVSEFEHEGCITTGETEDDIKTIPRQNLTPNLTHTAQRISWPNTSGMTRKYFRSSSS